MSVFQKMQTLENPKVVATQDELDSSRFFPGHILVCGGSYEKPLKITRPFAGEVYIGDNAVVLIHPASSSKPPVVTVCGDNAVVRAEKTARVCCTGNSIVCARDKAKVRMYAGKLTARGLVKCTLYKESCGYLHDHVKAMCRNQSTVLCYDNSITYLYHASVAFAMHESAFVFQKHRATTRIRPIWMRKTLE